MTNDAKRCAYYEAESENVKGRWACVVPPEVIQQGAAKGLTIPNNQADCQVSLVGADCGNLFRRH